MNSHHIGHELASDGVIDGGPYLEHVCMIIGQVWDFQGLNR